MSSKITYALVIQDYIWTCHPRSHTHLSSQLNAEHFEALHKNLFARYVANAMYIV